MTTENKRGRSVHVLIDGHVLFLKHTNKLFEVKLFVNFTSFFSLAYLDIFATFYVFHNGHKMEAEYVFLRLEVRKVPEQYR